MDEKQAEVRQKTARLAWFKIERTPQGMPHTKGTKRLYKLMQAQPPKTYQLGL